MNAPSRIAAALTALLLAAAAVPPAEAGYRRGGFVRSSSGRVYYRSGGYARPSSAPQRFSSSSPALPSTIRRPRRDLAVRDDFRRSTGYPNGRPGYEVDHRQALVCGGADATWNMQWLTVEQHKAKTRNDIANCRRNH